MSAYGPYRCEHGTLLCLGCDICEPPAPSDLPAECVECGYRCLESARPFNKVDADTAIAACPRCGETTYIELTPEEVAAQPFPTPEPIQIGPLDV